MVQSLGVESVWNDGRLGLIDSRAGRDDCFEMSPQTGVGRTETTSAADTEKQCLQSRGSACEEVKENAHTKKPVLQMEW